LRRLAHRWCTLIGLTAAILGVVVALPTGGLATSTPAPPGAGSAPMMRLPWPTKPFYGTHRIQGTLDEPRVLIGFTPAAAPLLEQGLAALNQAIPIFPRVAHIGVDISDPDGTPVYAVRSGVAVTHLAGSGTYVDVGAFAYWHLKDPVPTGTHVIALHTIIGRVYPGLHHLNFSRYYKGHAINQLRFGGFYSADDTARPVLGALRVFTATGRPLAASALPEAPIALFVRAYDIWSQGGTQVGVYKLSWSLSTQSGTTIWPTTTTLQADFLISNQMMGWIVSPDSERVDLLETDFSYRLFHPEATPLTPLMNFSTVTTGAYVIHISAQDAAGNTTNRSYPITVTAP
jgi:hypothetical protein